MLVIMYIHSKNAIFVVGCMTHAPEVGNYYCQGHPMKPYGIRMTLCRLHADDYVALLRNITTETQQNQLWQLKRFNVGEECLVFDGLYSFSQAYAAAPSAELSSSINHGFCDISINWAGGLHNAKKCEAFGFCYVNDIVLAILELLKQDEVS